MSTNRNVLNSDFLRQTQKSGGVACFGLFAALSPYKPPVESLLFVGTTVPLLRNLLQLLYVQFKVKIRTRQVVLIFLLNGAGCWNRQPSAGVHMMFFKYHALRLKV